MPALCNDAFRGMRQEALQARRLLSARAGTQTGALPPPPPARQSVTTTRPLLSTVAELKKDIAAQTGRLGAG